MWLVDGAAGASSHLALVAQVVDELAERDRREEDEPDDEHHEDDVAPLDGRVEDQHGATLAEWRARASAVASASGSPPSARAASTHASPSPTAPSARSAVQREISSASTATASTPPARAIRTSPCAYK